MVSKIPNESLQHIFSYIEDTNTLYSIIQVNHTWCENGIKFLWRNPFKNPYENPYRNKFHLINRAKILPTLIPFLKQEKVLELEKCVSYDKILISDTTLFYYHCFITHLDIDNFFRIVSTFFNRNIKDIKFYMDFIEQFRPKETEDQEFSSSVSCSSGIPIENSKLEQILMVILIFLIILAEGNANIKWLKIDFKYKDIGRLFYDNDEESDDDDLVVDEERMEQSIIKIEESLISSLNIDRARILFMNLEYLEYGRLSFKLRILEILSNVCKKLKTIKIEERHFQIIQKPLISLIRSQYHLEEIRIASSYEEAVYEIFSSLKAVSHSLRKIEICGMIITHDETLSFLRECKNLEILILEDSYISFKNFECIVLAELSKLCTLEVVNICSNDEFVSQANPIQGIIQNKIISKNLIELVIENISIKNHNLLEVISENCRNLVNLFTLITADSDIPFLFIILKNNSRLKDLRLTLPELYISNVDTTEFIVELAKTLPRLVTSVYLSNLMSSVHEYKGFLENCKVDELIYYMVNFSPITDVDSIDECEGFVKRWTEKKGKFILYFYEHKADYCKVYVVWDY